MNENENKVAQYSGHESESSEMATGTRSFGGAPRQLRRPGDESHLQLQAAANKSQQVNHVARLQSAANQFSGNALQLDKGDGKENDKDSSEPSSHQNSHNQAQGDDNGASNDAPQNANESAASGQPGDVDTLQTQMLNDAKQLKIVLASIHREYGEWFKAAFTKHEDLKANANNNVNQTFDQFDRELKGGHADAQRFYASVAGLEDTQIEANVKLELVQEYAAKLKGKSDVSDPDFYLEKIRTSSEKVKSNLVEAEKMLKKGRELFGKASTGNAIAIDKELVQESRNEQESEDDNLSLHQNDGPAVAMKALKAAMVRYVQATRKKEEVRSEAGVDKLKKVSDKAKAADSELAHKIEAARQEKDAAKAKYKELRKKVDEVLAQPLDQTTKNEIAAIDQVYLGISRQETLDHLDFVNSDKTAKRVKAKKLAKVTDQFALSEASYGKLHRSMSQLAEAEVGAKNFNLSVGVSFGFGVGNKSKIQVGGGIKYSGSTNIQDDRRLRVNHSLGVYGKGSADLAGVLAGSVGADLMKGKTEVFMDADHWASVMAFRFSKIAEDIKGLDDSQELIKNEFTPEQASEMLETSNLANDGITKVGSTSVSGSMAVKALGYGAEAKYKKSWMEFSKKGQDTKKQAKKTSKSITISPGSNIKITLTRTTVAGHANPDNDGKFWNIKVSLSGKVAGAFKSLEQEPDPKQFSSWEQGLRKALDADPNPSGGSDTENANVIGDSLIEDAQDSAEAGNFGDVAKAVSSFLGAEIVKISDTQVLGADFNVSLAKSSSLNIGWNYVKSASGKNELQYRRISKTSGIKASGSAPVADVGVASASVDVAAAKTTETMLSESLGDSTMFYLQKVFNGLNLRTNRDKKLDRNKPDQWAQFLAKHEQSVWVTLCKIGAGQGSAYTELNAAIASAMLKVEDDAPADVEDTTWEAIQSKAEAAITAAKALKTTTAKEVGKSDLSKIDTAKFAKLKVVLNNYLKHQGALNNAVRASEWK